MEEVTTKEPTIRVGILYNTFKPDEIEWHDLPYSEGATIKDYVGDMAEGSWSVGYGGNAYHAGEWESITLSKGDVFSFVQVPEGGGSTKDILRIVAIVAVMWFALAYVGPWAMAKLAPETAGIMGLSAAKTGALYVGLAKGTFIAAGMMAVNAVLPPAGLHQQKDDGQNYGIDGPKNTSKEGVVVPVGYGKYRTAGNIVDTYTKLVGQTQYMYMRMVVNDGAIKSAGEFEINGEPIANFKDYQTRVSLGSAEGEVNDWFGEAIRMQSIGVEVKDDWINRTTNTEVDRVRLDLVYPEGLGYHKPDGKILDRHSHLKLRYRKVGETVWKPLGEAYEQTFVGIGAGLGPTSGYGRPPEVSEATRAWYFANGYSKAEVNRLMIWGSPLNADGELPPFIDTYGDIETASHISPITSGKENVIIAKVPSGAGRATATINAEVVGDGESGTGYYDFGLYYREVGTTQWLLAEKREVGTVSRSSSRYSWASFPVVQRTQTARLDPAKRYEVTVFGGNITRASALITVNAGGDIHLIKKEKKTFRYTYESGALPRGRYEIGIRRGIKDDDNESSRDTVQWTDLAEIDVENIHYVGTANISLRIKVDDQLQSPPTFTSLIEASTVDKYDIEGNKVGHEWSPYPAWHFTDILLNQDRGRGMKTTRIDWPSILEWEQHCIENGLEFNAVFDSKTNVWDALQKVLRVGHAQLVRQGTKYAVVIDKKSEPVQIFNDSNIIEGTFSTEWLGLSERANELHYTFYPTDKGGKEEMLRVVDPIALRNGEEPRVLAISEQGVTSAAQAMFNIEKQLRENRLITKSVSFDAPLESISLTIGDVALIQHSSAHYGKGIGTGLLKRGTTASRLALDCPVKMEAGKDYRVLTVIDALKRYTVNIENISHKTLYVSGLPSGSIGRCIRLKQGDVDVGIDNIIEGNPFDRIIVKDASKLKTGKIAELWDTDVVEERQVVFNPEEVEFLDLVEPLSGIPSDHARWTVGPVETVKAPYRLNSVSGDDVYRRSLSFIEYNDLVYEPLAADYQVPKPAMPLMTAHVSLPSISWPIIVTGEQSRVTVKVAWERGDDNYGGADIYIARNGEDFEFMRSVQDVTAIELEAGLNDDLLVKIVAFGKNSIRQLVTDAPIVGALIESSPEAIAKPTITSVTTPRFKVDATVVVEWEKSPSAGVSNHRLQYAAISVGEKNSGVVNEAADWKLVALTQDGKAEIPNLTLGNYAFRVRAEKGRALSEWEVKTYEVTAPELPQRVTGLRLNMGDPDPTSDSFAGRDAKFVWNDVASSATSLGLDGADAEGMDFFWRDYLVRIKTASGALIREEVVRDAGYVYTLEKNQEDCIGTGQAARRTFRIEVSMRGRQGQESNAVGMTVSNHAPLPPAVSTVIAGVEDITLVLGAATDLDVEGYIVWASEKSGFTPNASNLVYRGPSGFATFKGKPKTKYFYRYAAYDGFGESDLRMSAEGNASTSGLTNAHFDSSFYDGVIPPDIMARIDLIDGEGTGSVNSRLAGVESKIEDDLDGLVRRMDSIVATAGSRVFYQNSTPTAGAVNDIWIKANENNKVFRWDGERWVDASDARISALTSAVDSVEEALADEAEAIARRIDSTIAIAQTRNRTFRQNSAPASTTAAPLAVGDLWYDTTNGANKPYRWGGASLGWQDTSDARITANAAAIQRTEEAVANEASARAQAINTVSAVANAKNRVYRQTSQPTNPVVGDVWVDIRNLLIDGVTRAGNVLKVWNGSAWLETTDGRIAANAAAIDTLKYAYSDENGSIAKQISSVSAQAQAKNQTFRQSGTPTGTAAAPLAVGDIWYKTNDYNRSYRWGGASVGWQETTDTRTAVLSADLTSYQKATADANKALAERIDTVTATAGQAKAIAESQSGAIATLEGKARAWLKQVASAGTASATLELTATDEHGNPYSSAMLLADEIGLGRVSDGTNRPVMKIRNGTTEIEGTLSASSGIFLAGSNGTIWPFALRQREFIAKDGVAINFGVNLGSIPQFDLSSIGLAPLNAGESYDLRLLNLTPTGCTPYLKINVPAVASDYKLTTDVLGGSGAPTRYIPLGTNPQSASGDYTLELNYSIEWLFYGNSYGGISHLPSRPVFGDGMAYWGDAELYGSITIQVWKQSGGVWTKATEIVSHVNEYYSGSMWEGPNTVSSNHAEIMTLQLGNDVQAVGVVMTRSSGVMLNYLNFYDFRSLAYTARGNGASVRSATPTGFQTKVTIRPQ